MPWGYWLVRLIKRDDIRRYGSGNVGGTHVWRVFGWRLGLPVVLFDTAKGFAPALAATLVVSHLAGVLAGAAAMLGHWRPLFLRWQRGGKMVATCGGAFLGVAPVVGGIGMGLWIAVFLLSSFAIVFVSVAIWRSSSNYPRESWWHFTPAVIKQMLGVLGFEETSVRYHVQRFAGRRKPLI